MKSKPDQKRQLAHALERLSAFARQEDWRSGEAENLTPTQADVLRYATSRAGGVRVSAAALHVGVSQPTASDAITTLVRKGLIEKRADPLDGRASLLFATRAGQALSRRWTSGFEAVVDALDDSDFSDMLAVSMRALQRLQATGAIPNQRMCLSCRFFSANAHPGKDEPHHCKLMDLPLGQIDLRADCPEHEASTAPV